MITRSILKGFTRQLHGDGKIMEGARRKQAFKMEVRYKNPAEQELQPIKLS